MPQRAMRGSLLLNTKASQEAACFRAPAAIVPGREPELRDAGVSRFRRIGSHLAGADAAEGHAGQVDGPGSSGNAENGSHLDATGAAEGHAGHADSPGSSGNVGIGPHLEGADTAEGHAGQVEGSGMSGNAGNGSHPAATDAAEGHTGQVAFLRERMRTGRSDAGTSGRARHARHFPSDSAEGSRL